jgi:REP element-mobilizing transposase RayT
METIEIEIKKDYVKSLMESLEKDDAIKIIGKKQDAARFNPSSLVGSWPKQSIEEIDETISKMRDEWDRGF